MTQPLEVTGPVCDLCKSELAIGSLMLLADYSTVKFGPDCGPDFLRQVAGQLAGDQPSQAEPESAQCPMCGQMVAMPDIEQHVADHAAAGDLPATDGQAVSDADNLPVDECPNCGAMIPLPDMEAHLDAHESAGETTGSQREHWAATRNVVRSTHGHRRSGQAADDTPAGGE